MNELYCDGGVIGHNPSEIGGTFAYRILRNGEVVCEKSLVITPKQAKLPAITNNLTEMCALVAGLGQLPDNWQGMIYSDSMVTLGRVFEGWKWNNIPDWLHIKFQVERNRLINWNLITYTLLDGHPTKEQLESGKGKRGHPVSLHNVWCDHACQEQAARFQELHP